MRKKFYYSSFKLHGRVVRLGFISRNYFFLLLLSFSFAHLNQVYADDWPKLSRVVIEKYLFLPTSDTYLIGDRIYKWKSDMAVHILFEIERPIVEAALTIFKNRKIFGSLEIKLTDQPLFDGDDVNLPEQGPAIMVMIEGGFDLFVMNTGPLRGLEAYHGYARGVGCYAQANVPYKDRDFIITSARILAKDALFGDALTDCLFKGLLLSGGLMYTPELAFHSDLLTESERDEALAVLKLLYHPDVEPGMSRDEFYKVLELNGLLLD